jgi:hypothetical protein
MRKYRWFADNLPNAKIAGRRVLDDDELVLHRVIFIEGLARTLLKGATTHFGRPCGCATSTKLASRPTARLRA